MATQKDTKEPVVEKSIFETIGENLKAASKEWWANNKSKVVDIFKEFVNLVIDHFKSLLGKK